MGVLSVLFQTKINKWTFPEVTLFSVIVFPLSLVNLCQQHPLGKCFHTLQAKVSCQACNLNFYFISKIMRVTDWMTCDSVPQMLAAKIKKRSKRIHCNNQAGRLLRLELCRILEKWFLTTSDKGVYVNKQLSQCFVRTTWESNWSPFFSPPDEYNSSVHTALLVNQLLRKQSLVLNARCWTFFVSNSFASLPLRTAQVL